MLNQTCKECGRHYHHCSSCGYEFMYDEDTFCSYFCARLHEQRKKIEDAFDVVMGQLDEVGRDNLANLLFPNRCDDDADQEYWYSSDDGWFDEDLVYHVLKTRYKDRLSMQTWGLW